MYILFKIIVIKLKTRNIGMIYSKSPTTGKKNKNPPKKNSDIVTLKKFSMKVRFLTIFFLITPPP